MLTLPENPEPNQGQPIQHGEQNAPHETGTRSKPLRLWLRRLLLLAVWIAVYSLLPDPWDTWLGIATVLVFGKWLYDRAAARMKLPPLPLKFEKIETITLSDILLALLFLAMLANHSDLVNLKIATNEVRDSVTDLQNSASENTDEIKSSLDDVKDAIEASQ